MLARTASGPGTLLARTAWKAQGPSFMTKDTGPSFQLCIPQNQWHLEYRRFPVVKDLLMQRLPLCACEKQTGREPGGWAEAMEASAQEPRAWREPMFTPGRAVLPSLICVFLSIANAI